MSVPALRRSLAALATLATLTSLAACGSEQEEASDEPTSGESASPSESESSEASEAAGTGVACEYPEDMRGAAKEVEPPPAEATVSGQVPVTIATSIGELNATLDAETTPCTVNSFVSLAEQGYFDGTSCHRMTTEGIYVLQCGDPTASGSGGPGYSFDDELSGSETYPAGTLAMANAGPGTNGSQFFIVYDDTQLPPSYTVFGTVDEATVQTVAEVAAAGTDDSNGPGDGAPKTPVDIESVTAG